MVPSADAVWVVVRLLVGEPVLGESVGVKVLAVSVSVWEYERVLGVLERVREGLVVKGLEAEGRPESERLKDMVLLRDPVIVTGMETEMDKVSELEGLTLQVMLWLLLDVRSERVVDKLRVLVGSTVVVRLKLSVPKSTPSVPVWVVLAV